MKKSSSPLICEDTASSSCSASPFFGDGIGDGATEGWNPESMPPGMPLLTAEGFGLAPENALKDDGIGTICGERGLRICCGVGALGDLV